MSFPGNLSVLSGLYLAVPLMSSVFVEEGKNRDVRILSLVDIPINELRKVSFVWTFWNQSKKLQKLLKSIFLNLLNRGKG